MFGPGVREIAYSLVEGVKRGTIDASVAKLILGRVLPASRPVQLDLPQITGGAALIEAEDKIVHALNEGRISPQEARALQDWAKTSFRNRRVARAAMGLR